MESSVNEWLDGPLMRPEALKKLFQDIKFTKEERELKSKYSILRRQKEKLKSFQNNENKDNCDVVSKKAVSSTTVSQDDLKKTALEVLKSRGLRKNLISDKETKDFKKATKQNGETNVGQKRCAMSEYTPETETLPRSVTVRGHNLTPEFLYRTFAKLGAIWKVRVVRNDQSAIVLFKTSESARLAHDTMDGCIVEGKQLSVSLTKKRNDSWVQLSTAEGRDRKLEYSYKEKRTIHVGYDGHLTVQDFKSIFSPFGKVERIYLSSLDAVASSRKQFALVTFEYEEEALNAIEDMNGQSFKGIPFVVTAQKSVFNDSTINSRHVPQRQDSRQLVVFGEDLMDM